MIRRFPSAPTPGLARAALRWAQPRDPVEAAVAGGLDRWWLSLAEMRG